MPERTTPRKSRGTPWNLAGWKLRTKVTVVLLVPVVVALALGGLRVSNQLDEASRLSGVRDQLSVLRGVVELATLVDRELVAAVATTAPQGLSVQARSAAVDTKAKSVQDAVDQADLSPVARRSLSVALGRLSGVRNQRVDTDPTSLTASYHDVIGELSEVVPAIVSSANFSDLDADGNAVKSLLQLRSAISVQEGLLRSVDSGPLDAATIVAAQRSAAEEVLLGQQLLRSLSEADTAEFTNATSSSAGRREVLDAALGTDLTAELRAQFPQIDAQQVSLNAMLTGLVDTLAGKVDDRTSGARSSALRDAAVVLVALLAALAVALLVARSLISPVRRLHGAVLGAAEKELPEAVERVRAGEEVDWRAIEPVPVHTEEEIGQLARAFDNLHLQAVRLAGEQAELRRQVSDMFMTLSRRSQSLVEMQLNVIEVLEAEEQDPQRLDNLFRLDHLATRLRRNGENLQVLAGGTPARRDHGPVTVVELLRAATSEVKDYRRVGLGHAPNGLVRAQAAADVVHILAELLENATRFSPPEHKVVLTADRGSDGGLLIEVIDRGLGMAPDDLAAANGRLAATDVASPETTRRMGLFVVSRLAARHEVTVRLRPTLNAATQAGVTASVHLPGGLVISAAQDVVPAALVPAAPPVNPPRTNGHQRNGAAAVRTPIFDQLASKWFTEEPAQDGWAHAGRRGLAGRARRARAAHRHHLDGVAAAQSGQPVAARLRPGHREARTRRDRHDRRAGTARDLPRPQRHQEQPVAPLRRHARGTQTNPACPAAPRRAGRGQESRCSAVNSDEEGDMTTQGPAPAEPTLSWLVSEFTGDVPGVAHAVLVSADGLLMAASTGLPRDRADQLSAMTSGLSSLAVGAAELFTAGRVVQSVIEMEHGFMMLMSVGDGSNLAVLASPGCDIGLVGYEMTLLVDRVGRMVDAPVRGPVPAGAPPEQR